MKRLRLFLVAVGQRTFDLPQIAPPLGIMSLAAYVRAKLDVDVRLVDQKAEGLSTAEVVRRATEFQADVVGLSSPTAFARLLPELVDGLHQALPGALVVLGGPHASALGEDALRRTGADVAVVGEGEMPLQQVLERYREKDGLSTVAGLAWRDSSGEVRLNAGPSPVVEDLDGLPFPAYDLLDWRRYHRLPRMTQVPFGRYAAVFTSRGCPYGCAYCHRIFGKRLRAQSAARIVEEIGHYVRSMNVDQIDFFDDAFNLIPKRVTDFAETVRHKGMKLRFGFPNAIRTDVLTDEVLDALVEMGTYHAALALDSGSPRILKLIGRNLDIGKYVENVAKIAGRRVFTHGYCMMGFPTETVEDLQATVDVACNSRLHTAAFFTVVPFPNTELYRWVAAARPEVLPNLYYGRHYSDVRVNISSVPDPVLFGLQREAWRRFYLNPGRAWRIWRDYPDRLFLLKFAPLFVKRSLKGLAG